MATYNPGCDECEATTGGGGGLGLVLILLVLAALVGGFLLIVSSQGVTYNDHATDKHGEDAELVRDCLDDKGPYMVMKHRFQPTWYLVCRIEENLFGIQAVTKDGQEKTAFIPKSGSAKDLKDYFGTWATRFKQLTPFQIKHFGTKVGG